MDENAAVVAVTFAVVTIASLLSAATGKVGKASAGSEGSEGAVQAGRILALPRPRQSNALGRYGSAASAGVYARPGSSGLSCQTQGIPLRNSPSKQQQQHPQILPLQLQQPQILQI